MIHTPHCLHNYHLAYISCSDKLIPRPVARITLLEVSSASETKSFITSNKQIMLTILSTGGCGLPAYGALLSLGWFPKRPDQLYYRQRIRNRRFPNNAPGCKLYKVKQCVCTVNTEINTSCLYLTDTSFVSTASQVVIQALQSQRKQGWSLFRWNWEEKMHALCSRMLI